MSVAFASLKKVGVCKTEGQGSVPEFSEPETLKPDPWRLPPALCLRFHTEEVYAYKGDLQLPT